MSKGIEYVIGVIDRATAPLQRVINAISGVGTKGKEATQATESGLDDVAETAKTVADTVSELGNVIADVGTSGMEATQITESGLENVGSTAQTIADTVSELGNVIADVGTSGVEATQTTESGLEDVGKTAKTVADTVEDVGKAIGGVDTKGKKATKSTEKGFEDMGKTAQTVVRTIEHLGTSIENLPSSLYKKIGGIKGIGNSFGSMFKANFLANIATDIVRRLGGLLNTAGSVMFGGLFDKEKVLAGLGPMEDYAKTLPGMWETAKGTVSKSLEQMGEALKPSIVGIMQLVVKVTDKIPAILDRMQPAFDWINNTVLSIINGTGIWGSIMEKVRDYYSHIEPFVTWIVDEISGILDGTSEWWGYLDIIGDLWSYVADVAGWIQGNVLAIVMSAVEWIKQSELLKDIFSAISTIVETIIWLVGDLVDKMKGLWDSVIKPILDGIETGYRWLKSMFGWGDDDTVVTVTKVTKTDPEKDPEKTTAATTTKKNELAKRGAMDAGRSSSMGVNSGGSKPTTINITIQKLQDKIEIFTSSVKEGAKQAADDLVNEIVEALYSIDGKV